MTSGWDAEGEREEEPLLGHALLFECEIFYAGPPYPNPVSHPSHYWQRFLFSRFPAFSDLAGTNRALPSSKDRTASFRCASRRRSHLQCL